jgi:hypothetical protein
VALVQDHMSIASLCISVVGALVAMGSAFSSRRSAEASEKSASASVRQADAAEAQINALPIQLESAQTAAGAAMRQAELAFRSAEEAKTIAKLSEHQMKTALMPILNIERRQLSVPGSLTNIPIFVLVNQGKGPALNISGQLETTEDRFPVVPNVLAAEKEYRLYPEGMVLGLTLNRMYLNYDSQDGRHFITSIEIMRSARSALFTFRPTRTSGSKEVSRDPSRVYRCQPSLVVLWAQDDRHRFVDWLHVSTLLLLQCAS